MTSDLRDRLRRTSRLPEGWSEPEVVEDVIVADGLELRRAGMSSVSPGGEEIPGAAVELTDSPVPRSYFELLERISTLDALRSLPSSCEVRTLDGELAGRRRAADVFPESDDPARWRYARSNGVALHRDWETAALRAFWELSERDRILRAWYGEISPVRLAFEPGATSLGRTASYEWAAYSFGPSQESVFSRDIQVIGVFGFPKRSEAPFVCGYAARPDGRHALDAAVAEALQQLAFLWGEPALERLADPAPTPMHHLDRLQWPAHHDVLRRWLGGAHMAYRPPAGKTDEASVGFVDLTPAWLEGGLRVVKAVCEAATPLAFGDAPFGAHLPAELRVHPIA